MINSNQIDVIFSDFLMFLHGIQEDTPIPRETKYVYFVVDFSNGDICLSYSADEKKFMFFDYGAYCPLEAQYFFCGELSKLAIWLFDKKCVTKKQVMSVLKDITLSAKKCCNFLKTRYNT